MAENEKIILSNVNEVYTFISCCDPYKIRKATLHGCLDGDREVYVVALRGTNQSFDKNDPLSIPVCFQSFASKDTIYTELVKNDILKTVPAGSNLVFVGHSLGGMTCEIMGADEELRAKYHILSVLTMGSPYVVGKGKKCPLHRMADKIDIIPALFSLALVFNSFMGSVTLEFGHKWNIPIGPHCDSYMYADCWKKYDVFGVENGGRTLEIAPEEEKR